MELKEIQELIKFVSKSGVNEVSIEKDDFKITIKTLAPQQTVIQATIPSALSAQAIEAPSATIPTTVQTPAPQANTAANNSLSSSKAHTIKSPMIGTYYGQPSPEKPSFVNIGDEIRKGQTICIVEAMKLFNEIESEVSGRITKILVNNSSPVEFDQPLFEVELN